MTQRIYLDNAATSFPKPECVYQAMERYHREWGGAAGRGAYQQAIDLQHEVDRARVLAARFFNAESPNRMIFTFNGTDSLNMAIHGILRPGDHVVTSVLEHNSVIRPLRELESRIGIEITVVGVDSQGVIDPAEVASQIRPQTHLVAITHASNVTGMLQPISEISRIVKSSPAMLLVDAAQTAGHVEINVRELNVDMLVCPGHKGLLGPLGTGLLYIRPGVEAQLNSFRQGGTGTRSDAEHQPDQLPDKYESGNHNAPGLCGLAASLEWLMDQTWDRRTTHERVLTEHFLNGIQSISGIRLLGSKVADERVGVISFTVNGLDSQEAALLLDQMGSINVRAGLHCAPGTHAAMDTLSCGGAVRVSFSPFTSVQELDISLEAIQNLTMM